MAISVVTLWAGVMIRDLLLGLTKLPGSEFSSSGGSVSPLLALVSGDASHLHTPSPRIHLSVQLRGSHQSLYIVRSRPALAQAKVPSCVSGHLCEVASQAA